MDSMVELRTPARRHAFACPPGERLLYAALSAGADLSYGCATGTCGNCRATVLEGSVATAWTEAPGHKALRRPGEILLCQGVPQGNCVVEAGAGAWPHPRELSATYAGRIARVVPSVEGLSWIEIELDRAMRFHAGQFVLVAMDGVEGFRAYSPAQDGAAVTRLSLVVRAKPEGALSPLLCVPDVVGRSVQVFGPLGTAHVRPAQDQDMAIVVGGSGCAVALSLLDWAVRSGHLGRHRIDLVCGLRSSHCPEVMDRLAAAAAVHGERLRIVVALSDPAATPTVDAAATLRFDHGFAHDVAARTLPPEEWRQRAVFVAGPAPMVEATLRMLVLKARLSPASIRHDSF
jgi:toluene monooxygenase electron transfer component